MKRWIYISLFIILSCEEVVIVDLPDSQNLVVVEGFVTDSLTTQRIRITRSNAFSDLVEVTPIPTAQVLVQSRSGEIFNYEYDQNGFYTSIDPFEGSIGTEYRVRILLDTLEIRSEWDRMPDKVSIDDITVESFLENDPENPNQQITIYFPKIDARDPASSRNFYRWQFYQNGVLLRDPESITIQDDRFFDGNLIPNNFDEFEYSEGDEIIVQLYSLSSQTFNYLSLLKSQITTLGTSSATTPAIVEGNLSFQDEEGRRVLGYFGAISFNEASITVE